MPPQGNGATTVRDFLLQEAERQGVPGPLALAIVHTESRGKQKAISPVGARGLFQLMPDTAKALGVDPDDPFDNIRGGLTYFKQQLDAHKGDVRLALAAYNAGPSRTKGGTVPDIPETRDYVRRVLETWQQGGPQATPAAAGAPPTPSPPLPAAATRGMLPPSTPSTTTEQPYQTPTSLGALTALRGAQAIGAAPPWYAAYDPRTFRGRVGLTSAAAGLGAGLLTRNPAVGGTAGAGVTAAATTAVRTGVAPWLIRVLGPPVAAGVAGGSEAAAEVALGTAPAGTSPVTEGLTQGAYEIAGQTIMWPIRRVAGAFLGSRVGAQASTALAARVGAARETGRTAVQAVRTRVQEGLDAAKLVASATLDAARQSGRQTVRAATRTARTEMAETHRLAGQQARQARESAVSLLADTELQNADAIAQVTRQYDNLLARAPSAVAPGMLTRGAVEGPAKRALDMAGQRVAEAAVDGPPIAMTPIKVALDEMVEKARPTALFPAKAPPAGIGFLRNVQPRQTGAAASTHMSREEFQAYVAKQLGVEETHPLPGILGRVQEAPESLSFAETHRLKMLLDEAVNWDRTAKKHLERITKGLRGIVREALAVHEPYNQATAAYQAIVPLYRRGIGKQVITAAVNDPDRIARTLNPKNPAQAMALKDLIVTQSAAGGDAASGQQAWDAVRSTFTYNHVVKGGIAGLADRVRQLVEQSPEFARVIYNDLPAQKILTNLETLGQSYTSLVTKAEAERVVATAAGTQLKEAARVVTQGEVVAARARGLSAVEAAKETAQRGVTGVRQQTQRELVQLRQQGRAQLQQAVAASRQTVQTARATQEAFRTSSVGRALNPDTMHIADLARFIGLGPTRLWGMLSFLRLLEGAKGPDIIRWAAYSDRTTQQAVQLIEGTLPERAVVNLIRGAITASSSDTAASE